MRLVYFPLDEPMLVEVSLPNGMKVSKDLNVELSIQPRKLKYELINQPSKYATWATVAELARRRVKNHQAEFFKLSGNEGDTSTVSHQRALYNQYKLLDLTKRAFSYRKDALLGLLSGNDSQKVIEEYHNNLSSLRALIGREYRS